MKTRVLCKNFLRIKIKKDEVMVYPVGLDRVPHRRDWKKNSNWKAGNKDEPAYLPNQPLTPHLIEGPIAIRP